MKVVLVLLAVIFGILLTVNGQSDFYEEIDTITDNTAFEDLPEDMKKYVKNMFTAKKNLDTILGKDFTSRVRRCRYRLQIDENAFLYLLKRWSSEHMKVPTKSGSVVVDMSHNWYMRPSARLVYTYDCIFNPNKLVEDTMTLK